MKEQITYDTFDKIDIRLGTVISVKKMKKLGNLHWLLKLILEKKLVSNNLQLKSHITITLKIS